MNEKLMRISILPALMSTQKESGAGMAPNISSRRSQRLCCYALLHAFVIDPSLAAWQSCADLRVYPKRFGQHTVMNLPKLMSCGEGTPRTPDFDISGPGTFMNMEWHDWPEANLKPVAVYLRGGTSLRLSAAWRAVFPTSW